VKALTIFSITVLCVAGVSAQEYRHRPTYELMGSAFFDNSSFSEPNSGSLIESEDLQTLTLKPTAGYFLTESIELLADLKYEFSVRKTNTTMGPVEFRRHRLGIAFGASYNLMSNSDFIPFVGAKIGVTWSRTQPSSFFDTGWGKPEIAFPAFLLGGRFFLAQDWAFIASVEYSVTSPYGNPSVWKSAQSTTFGFGFSVFL